MESVGTFAQVQVIQPMAPCSLRRHDRYHASKGVIMKECGIVHENGRFWVKRELFKMRAIFKVMENVGTHSVVRDTFDLRSVGALRAIEKCNQRAGESA